MGAGVFEVFDTRYYTHCFGLFFVAPFAIWFVVSMIRVLMRATDGEMVKGHWPILSAVIGVAVLMAVFWDVYQIGQQATKFCNERGGVYVYRIAQAESFIGASSIEHWSEYGFEYVEYEGRKGKTRYFLEDGMPTFKRVEEFKSMYELVITRKKLTPKITIHQYEIVEISTNETLGETSQLAISGGWADMLFYGITGFSYSPWICKGDVDDDFSPVDIVKAVLKPLHK